jgi:pilus assembly protein Flp/PilA
VEARSSLIRSGEFLRCEDEPTAVEYAVMLALIIVFCLVAITALGKIGDDGRRGLALLPKH